MSAPIAFINLDGINVTPYFEHYEHLLTKPYDYIYWQRSDIGVEPGAQKVWRYKHTVSSSGSKKYMDLLAGYFGFRQFARRILMSENYQRVIALTGNSAVLVGDVLKQKYRGRYLIDIRDYFLENNPLYRMLEEKIIDSSGLSIISSPAYSSFLGEHDFLLMHNAHLIPQSDILRVKQRSRPGTPLVLASIGTAKNIELDKLVLDYFANDSRFKLMFLGRGYEQLRPYIESNKIENAIVSGEFDSSQTYALYENVDVVMSMYGSKSTHVKNQLTNKLYYAAQLHLPILVSPGSYMETISSEYDFGLACDLSDESLKDKIFEMFEPCKFKRMCDRMDCFMEDVLATNRKTNLSVQAFLQ